MNSRMYGQPEPLWREQTKWNHDPGDLGIHGESHRWYPNGSGHHTLWREDGSHISWDTDPYGNYNGNGHTDWGGNVTPWSK